MSNCLLVYLTLTYPSVNINNWYLKFHLVSSSSYIIFLLHFSLSWLSNRQGYFSFLKTSDLFISFFFSPSFDLSIFGWPSTLLTLSTICCKRNNHTVSNFILGSFIEPHVPLTSSLQVLWLSNLTTFQEIYR